MPIGPSLTPGMVTDYTGAIQVIPNTYGKIQASGIFGSEGVATTTVIIDQVEDSLEVLPEVPRGGPASQATPEVQKQLPLIIPYIPHVDFLLPADVQDRRMPGDTGPDTLTRKRSKKLAALRRRQALTLEFLRMGALKGSIVGGTGNELYNLYTQFGVTKKTISFALATADTKINDKIYELKSYIEDNTFSGGMLSGIHVYCSPEFFRALISHASMVEAYKYFQATARSNDPLRADVRNRFEHLGVVFEEYNANVKLLGQSNTTRFIDANKAHAFPLGVEDMFTTYFAPANKIDYVNTEGQEIYAFEYVDPEGNYIKMESISAPLPICKRPQVLVELTA